MYCPHCGVQIAKPGRDCTSCGGLLPPPPDGLVGEDLRHLLPVNTDPVSIVAGYMGLCGFVLCGFPGPVSVVLGVWGLKRLSDLPGTRGHVRAWVGIVLGLLQTVFGAVMLHGMVGGP